MRATRSSLLFAAILFLITLVQTLLVSPRLPARQGEKQVRPPQTVACVGVNVVPLDRERILEAQTVFVKEGRIAAIGPEEKIAVPKDALRVDGRGKYLLPGLADLHVHLQEVESNNHAMFDMFLANGVTTILNLYGTPEHLKLRESIRRGRSEEHTSELQSLRHLVCRLLLEKKKTK